MLHTLRKWFGKEQVPGAKERNAAAWLPKTAIPTSPKSRPFSIESFSLWDESSDYLTPPGLDPRTLFPLFRALRDYIPDVSAGVWAWARLCATPQSYTLSGGTDSDQEWARQLLTELDRRIYGLKTERTWGVEALTNCFFHSIFTYGSFCGEVVLDERRTKIERFIVIDPATIRFKLNKEDRSHLPFQIQKDGSLVPLQPASFFYYGLDSDGLNPYGRSPLTALPLAVKIQQQMLRDMAKTQHNAGYPTIHFRITPSPRDRGESLSAYHERLERDMRGVREELRAKQADSNLITHDNIEVHYIGPDGRSQQWSESMQAVSEQVISALHLAPFMLGRNWGTTESWGAAQYQLITNNARSVQSGAKRLAEWLRNLELILHGCPVSVEHHFAPHHNIDATNRAQAFKTTAETLIALEEKGIIDPNDAKNRVDSLLRLL